MLARCKPRNFDATRPARVHLKKALELLESPDDASLEQMIHAVRKRIKKTRAMVLICRESVGKKAAGKVDRILRDASRPLSSLRDASALLSTVSQLQERSLRFLSSEPFDRWKTVLEIRKNKILHEAIDGSQVLARIRKQVGQARRQIGAWDDRVSRGRVLEAIRTEYRRGRRAYRQAAAQPTSENLHELRKHVKSLGYQLRFLEDKRFTASSPLLLLSTLLSSELGAVHDYDVLSDHFAGQTDIAPINNVLERRRTDLRQASLQRAGVLYSPRAKAFIDRLKTALWP